MIRLVHVAAALALIISASVAYRVNARARAALDDETALLREIAERRASLEVLKAEWAYLNSPVSLMSLSAPYAEALALAPREPEQMVDPAALPMRRVAP